MAETNRMDFSSDTPISKGLEDRLNRGPFVGRVVRILQEQPRGSSLTLGIYGQWGEGKTSVLNMLRNELNGDDSIIVLDLNPWRLTNEEAVFRTFVNILAGAIKVQIKTMKEKAVAKIPIFARLFRGLTKVLEYYSPEISTVNELLKSVEEVAACGDILVFEELRNRIIKHLAAADEKIVVIIDDIDRLDNHEIHGLFRLIKACADFPNVYYVLAFDDNIVADSISNNYGKHSKNSGKEFLEKIIQVPLQLPIVPNHELRALCFEELSKALALMGVELTRDNVNDIQMGLDINAMAALRTVRNARRYVNCILFSVPILKDEVNIADLIIVEALRVLYPEAYTLIRNNQSYFSGVEGRYNGSGNNVPMAKQLLETLFDKLPKERSQAIQGILTQLFPRMKSIYGKYLYGDDSVKGWSSEKRICAMEYCGRYFSFSIPSGDIADALIVKLLTASGNEELTVVDEILNDYLGTCSKRLLAKLRVAEAQTSPVAARTLSLSLAKRAYLLPNPETMANWEAPPGQAAILISQLIRRLPAGEARIIASNNVMLHSEPLWFAAECIRWLHITDKPEESDHNALTDTELQQVREVLVQRIEYAATIGDVFFDPDNSREQSILYEWLRARGRDTTQDYLINTFSRDNAQVARFLRSQVSLGWPMDGSLPHVSNFDTHNFESLGHLIDVDMFAALVKQHCHGDFNTPEYYHDNSTPLETRLAEQFMVAYNKHLASKIETDQSASS